MHQPVERTGPMAEEQALPPRLSSAPAAVRRGHQRRPLLRRFGSFVADVFHASDKDRILGLAAETAFFAVLSIFPALLVITGLLGVLDALLGADLAAQVEEAVVDFLSLVLTAEAAGAVESVQDLFEGGPGVLTVATGLAVIAIMTAFSTVLNALNITYHVPETRSLVRRRLIGLGLGLGSIVILAVLLVFVVVGPLLGRGTELVASVGLGEEYEFLWSYLRWPVAFLALAGWATTMCHVSPSRRQRWRQDVPGGVLAALLWLAASVGFNGYLRVVAQGNPVLSALGGGLILMTWVYLLSLSLLIGGEVNAARSRRRRGQPRRPSAAAAVQ